MSSIPRISSAVSLAACLLSIATPAAASTVVTFDAGAEGWIGPAGGGGSTSIEATGGNPTFNMHTVFNNFGITFRNDSNAAFVFDYTTIPSVTLGIELRVEAIDVLGSPVSRPWLIELRDYDDPPKGFPWVSVWYKFADISAAAHGSWTGFSVSIADTFAEELPDGWGGYGAEGPGGEPMLPADRSFTDVLAGVDEVAWTTLEPGFFFTFTDFDLRIDNVTIEADLLFADGFESGDTTAWSSVGVRTSG